jgi:hypothetical protein
VNGKWLPQIIGTILISAITGDAWFFGLGHLEPSLQNNYEILTTKL